MGAKARPAKKTSRKQGSSRRHAAARDPKVLERFWIKVRIGGAHECWPWLATTDRNGHGRFKLDGRMVPAHRFAFDITFYRIPRTRMGLHKCDVHGCCNPKHVYSGNALDNANDCTERGRRIGLPRGLNPATKLSDKQVDYIRRSDKTQRELALELGVARSTVGYAITGSDNWTKRRRSRPNQWKIRTALKKQRERTGKTAARR